MNKDKNLGFTLVELLVVIAIIGILSTVAVVNLNASRDKAVEAAAINYAQNYQTVAQLCDSYLQVMNDPKPASVYVPGAEVCTGVDVYWPPVEDLPDGFEQIDINDNNPGDGQWLIVFIDSDWSSFMYS